jgi:hypothetical protein
MHNGKLVKIPMENIVAGPFHKLAAAIPPVRFRSQRKRSGWGTLERLAVREGYEQYGPNWSLIARRLQYRTATQCRKMMMNQFIEYAFSDEQNAQGMDEISLSGGSEILSSTDTLKAKDDTPFACSFASPTSSQP